MTDSREIALKLLKATSLPDSAIYTDSSKPRYTTVDYYRMACHLLFECQRCGTCCTTGDPIRLRKEDAVRLAKHLKIPLNKAVKKYTVPDPERPDALDFKHICPCKFYDSNAGGCKIYPARPWSCRIFPFLGIYGSEDQVKVNESCPGSVKTMRALTSALEEAKSDQAPSTCSPDDVRQAKEWLKRALTEIQEGEVTNIDNLE